MGKETLEILTRLHKRYQSLSEGKLAHYIPELGKVDRSLFGISICTVNGDQIAVGDADTLFTIQSVSKPFTFGLALDTHGDKVVRSRVGVEPTGDPFHSMIRLDNESKRPYNPLVNTGAIAMTNLVREIDPKRSQEVLLEAFSKYAGQDLAIDEAVYDSEKLTGHRNRAIAHLMLHFGMVNAEVEQTLDLYFRQCAVKVSASILALMAATLANKGVNPKTGVRAVKAEQVKKILTIMFSCGLYDYAGDWAYDVGIPAKSGVSGGILAVVPGKFGVGVYSPLVDSYGNSVRGLKACEDLSHELGLHVFEM